LTGARWQLFDDSGSDVIAAGDGSLQLPHLVPLQSQSAGHSRPPLLGPSSGSWA
jgi:hypothetical protein